MADYNKNYMAAYKQYGESMIAGGGGTNLSGTGSSTMQVWNYGNDDQPSGLGAPTTKPKEEKKSESFWDRITNLFTSNDVDVTNVYTPSVNPASVYDSDAFNPAQVEDYVYRADMSEQTQDMVEQAMGYEKTKLGQLQLLDTRAMTEEEKKRLGPLLDLADDIRNENIKTTELPPIKGEQQSSLMDALMEGQPTAGLMQRPSVFTGQETQIASTLPDWMEALPLEGFSQALIDIREGRIDRETGQPIVQEEEVDLTPPEAADQELIPTTTTAGADVAPEIDTAPPEQTGLMSRPEPVVEEVPEETTSTDFATLTIGDTSESVAASEHLTNTFTAFTDVEGDYNHVDGRGFFTMPYGVVPDNGTVKKADGTAFNPRGNHGYTTATAGSVDTSEATHTVTVDKDTSYTVKRSDYDSDEAFAKGVLGLYNREAAKKYGSGFDSLPTKAKETAIDIAWNGGVGAVGWKSVKAALKETTKENPKTKTLFGFTVNFRSGTKYPRGLFKRRLIQYNKIANEADKADTYTTEAVMSGGVRIGTKYIANRSDGTVIGSWTYVDKEDKPNTTANEKRIPSIEKIQANVSVN